MRMSSAYAASSPCAIARVPRGPISRSGDDLAPVRISACRLGKHGLHQELTVVAVCGRNDVHNVFAGHRGAIDVVNVNDCVVSEPETISTNAMTSVPPVSWTDTGFPRRSTSTRLPA